LTVKQKITLIFTTFEYIGSDDFKAWGVTSHNVVVESAPITELTVYDHKIEQLDFVTKLGSLTIPSDLNKKINKFVDNFDGYSTKRKNIALIKDVLRNYLLEKGFQKHT
jgi:hypothetical protein